MNKNMKNNMGIEKLNTDVLENPAHSHAGHMWMMAIFCGVPIIGFLAIGLSGVNVPSLEIVFFIMCAIGMVGMMVMMNRDSDGKEKAQTADQSEKGANYETGK